MIRIQIFTIFMLLVLCQACTRFHNDWENICNIHADYVLEYGSSMLIDENGSILLSSRSYSGALKIKCDASKTKETLKVAWPSDKYWEWKRRIFATPSPRVSDKLATEIQDASRNAFYKSLISEIKIAELIKAIDDSPDEERGVLGVEFNAENYPVWKNSAYDDKLKYSKDILNNFLKGLGSYYHISLQHEGTYYGSLEMMDDDWHQFYSGHYYPEAISHILSNLSPNPVVYLNDKIDGMPVIMTHLYTMGPFREYAKSHWVKFLGTSQNRIYLFSTNGLWVLSDKRQWKEPENLPVHGTSKLSLSSLQSAYFLDDKYLYVFGQSKHSSEWAIYRIRRSEL